MVATVKRRVTAILVHLIDIDSNQVEKPVVDDSHQVVLYSNSETNAEGSLLEMAILLLETDKNWRSRHYCWVFNRG